MSFWGSVRNLFSRGTTPSLDESVQRDFTSPAAQAFLRGDVLPRASQQLVSPYQQHGGVYACIRAQWVTFPQAPFELWSGKKQLTRHPLLSRLLEPSPFMTSTELWQYTILFLETRGNALWWLDNDGDQRTVPRNILVFNPSFFRPVKDRDTGFLAGYTFHPGNGRPPIFLSPDEVIHFRYPNPDDPFWGMGPLQVAQMTAQQDYKAALYNSSFFENSAEPGGLMLYKGKVGLTETQKQTIMKTWVSSHQGVGNAFRLGVLPGEDWDYKQLGITHRDMQFLEQGERNLREIARIFNVPLIFINEYEKTGLSDAGVKHMINLFWDTNLIPKGRLFAEVLNRHFLPNFGNDLTCLFDFDEVPARQKDFADKLAQAKQLAELGYPLNDINRALDLGMDDVPWGDEIYLNSSLVPVTAIMDGVTIPSSSTPALPEPKDTDDEEGDGDEERQTGVAPPLSLASSATRASQKEQRYTQFWRSFTEAVAPIETAYQQKIRRHFYALRVEVLRNLSAVQGGRSLARTPEQDIEHILFAVDPARRELYSFSEPLFTSAYEAGGLLVIGELGLDATFLLDSTDARTFLQNKLVRVQGINRTVREQLRATLMDGLTEGESLLDLSARVRRVFNAANSRSLTIARTEIGQAVSGGRYQAMREHGIRQHMWLSSRDSHVREAHAPKTGVDGEVRELTVPFSNGLMFPLDPRGDAGETINCFLPGTRVSGRFIAGLKSWYTGKAVEIVTQNGYRLSVTINHPILTDRGFVPAYALQEGNHVISQRRDRNGGSSIWKEENEQRDACVEDVFHAIVAQGAEFPVPFQGSTFDLYGESKESRSQVQRVVLLRALALGSFVSQMKMVCEGMTSLLQFSEQCKFIFPQLSNMPMFLSRFHSTSNALWVKRDTARDVVRLHSLLPTLLFRHLSPFYRLCFALGSGGDVVGTQYAVDGASLYGVGNRQGIRAFSGTESLTDLWLWEIALQVGVAADLNIMLPQSSPDNLCVDVPFVRQLRDAFPSLVTSDEIVHVRQFDYAGHVYDLQSPVGYLMAGKIASRNCRCVSLPMVQ